MKRLVELAPWYAACMGVGLTLWLFYPGFMSWDSAYQWWQARHTSYDSVQPPLMSMIWRVCDKVWSGPGGMFVVQITLIWSALATFVALLERPPWQKILLVLLIGFWPPLFGLSLHLWKDLWTMLAFAWAVVFLLRDAQQASAIFRILALLAITAACAFRHNALTGALPFLFWIAYREATVRKLHPSFFRNAVVSVLLTLLVLLVSKIPNLDPRVKHTQSIWSAVTLWDASAVSLKEGKIIIPALLKDNSLNLQDLQNNFNDYTNTTIYNSGKLKYSFGRHYSPEESKALTELMLSLPTRHSRAYFEHRMRLAVLLYGLDQKGLPDGQVLVPGIVQYADNPVITLNPSKYKAPVLQKIQSWIDTPLFAGWIYLSISFLLCFGIFIPRRSAIAGLALAISISSLAYALPLAFVSGSAEFRYLAWPVLACWLSLALLFSTRGRDKVR